MFKFGSIHEFCIGKSLKDADKNMNSYLNSRRFFEASFVSFCSSCGKVPLLKSATAAGSVNGIWQRQPVVQYDRCLLLLQPQTIVSWLTWQGHSAGSYSRVDCQRAMKILDKWFHPCTSSAAAPLERLGTANMLIQNSALLQRANRVR